MSPPPLGLLTEPVLLIVGLCLMPLAGFWLWRRFWRPAPARRTELWSRLLFLALVVGPQLIWRLLDLRDRQWSATATDWGWLTLLAALAGLQLWRLPALWRAARAERLAASAECEAAPSLRGQLLLVLLPVVGLAVAGMFSLARDRAAVEAAARREAEELSRELAGKLSKSWPGQLGEVEIAGNVWNGGGVVGGTTVHWSGEVQTNADPNGVATLLLERGWRNYHGPPEEVLPVELRFAADGRLTEPRPYRAVPTPPQWFLGLTNEVAAAWENLREAETGSPEGVAAAAQAVGRLTREPGPNRLAEFLSLRHAAAEDTNAVPALLKLGLRAVVDRCETESGLPLGAVALAEAVRRAPAATLDRNWFALLRELTFTQPSSLTPWALDIGDGLAARSSGPAEVRLMGEVRARWRSAERLRELGLGLTDMGPLGTDAGRNRWFTNRAGVWFAVGQPSISMVNTSTNGRRLTITNQETRVRLFSADTLALAAFNGLHLVVTVNGRERVTPPRLPVGLRLSLELEGRQLRLPTAPWAVDDAARPSPVLATSADEFRQEAVRDQTGERFDDWPSRPQFTVRVHLADSAALFAAQRRQQWLFGGMILVTAGVAGLGAWQMNRAFRRQLALNAEKSNFVASVSHELRTPLASLRLLAEGLAAGRVEEESKRREYAGFLVQETRRLGALVENVLDFARIDQGRKQYQFEPTDLGRLVTATVRLFEPLAAERRVRLELNLPAGSAEPGGSLELNADGAALQQSLVNLLDNALKHAPADSVVTVVLEGADRAPQGWVRLSVRDAGPGIPPEDHERIFERFFRRGSELRRETQGVGLGLAIVKHIVAAHRGRVWVESQPGQGARFVVELPLGESNQCSVASNRSAGRNDQ